jgi:hypothetical protein
MFPIVDEATERTKVERLCSAPLAHPCAPDLNQAGLIALASHEVHEPIHVQPGQEGAAGRRRVATGAEDMD